MQIWEYKSTGPTISKEIVDSSRCIFCTTELRILYYDQKRPSGYGPRILIYEVRVCPTCGWWIADYEDQSKDGEVLIERSGAYGHLRTLDLTDISIPIEEVKKYLFAKYEHRFTMHPRLFEETVASVFRALGYCVHVTTYQNDGGIDVVLVNSLGETIGVQVKRYRDKVNIEQIRAFAGALFLKGFTQGIFVTTSSFRSGALGTASRSAARGIPVELMDAKRFYEALRIGTRELYASFDEWKDVVGKIRLQLLELTNW